jgi:Rieske Fe-S protein
LHGGAHDPDTVGSSSPLAPVGSAALVNTSAGSFLVARIAQDSFTALTATCTHFGCTISGYESPTFVSPHLGRGPG